ncbi:hypothetical protein [Chlorobium phaeobacteroides]|jgi:hypothetical protein|uniref:hypothetical protein n=1 Tax=Chlorobium phaeobacteroides TaxID=1096 RepID=UPI0002E7A8A1|nr:hypothetical protein [Chlorobium phaeobacteroides]
MRYEDFDHRAISIGERVIAGQKIRVSLKPEDSIDGLSSEENNARIFIRLHSV